MMYESKRAEYHKSDDTCLHKFNDSDSLQVQRFFQRTYVYKHAGGGDFPTVKRFRYNFNGSFGIRSTSETSRLPFWHPDF